MRITERIQLAATDIEQLLDLFVLLVQFRISHIYHFPALRFLPLFRVLIRVQFAQANFRLFA